MSTSGVLFRCGLGERAEVVGYTSEVLAAMKLLEPLLRRGLIAVHPDQWNQGQLSFLRPGPAARQGWSVHVPDLHVDRWALLPVEDVRAESVSAVAGIVVDPVIAALESTAMMLRDEARHMISLGMELQAGCVTTPLHRRLESHFDELLRRQLDAMSGSPRG